MKSDSGSTWVIRGGGWGGNAGSVRAAIRYDYAPSVAFGDVGFRCARSIN
jgi:formylglycine-generating enzyme required for sulfatase activity